MSSSAGVPRVVSASRSRRLPSSRVRLPKAARLRRRREFLAVQQRGQKVFAGAVLVIALDRGAAGPRIGITVSSKVANAVERNRVKRWVREAFRALRPDLPPVDLVVIARKEALAIGIDGARAALRAAGERLARGRA